MYKKASPDYRDCDPLVDFSLRRSARACFPTHANQPTAAYPTPATDTAAPIEINVGTANLLGDDEAVRDLIKSQAELFESTHPHIKINLVPWGWDARAFPEQLALGQVPDVMEIAATEGPLVIDNGYAADLTPFMEQWSFSRDFNEQILSTFARDGRVLYSHPT